MAYVYSLNIAADFGDLIGQTGGDQYRALADKIKVNSIYIFGGDKIVFLCFSSGHSKCSLVAK